MDRMELKAITKGIRKEQDEHPFPPKHLKCADCKKMDQREITCPLYQPKNIPMDVLKGKTECPEFDRE